MLKANLFNDRFNQQCTTKDNQRSIIKNITFETEKKFSNLQRRQYKVRKVPGPKQG